MPDKEYILNFCDKIRTGKVKLYYDSQEYLEYVDYKSNDITLDYIEYLFQPLLLRIHRMPPVTNCLLLSSQYFPCGTHIVCILQQNNCIVLRCA